MMTTATPREGDALSPSSSSSSTPWDEESCCSSSSRSGKWTRTFEPIDEGDENMEEAEEKQSPSSSSSLSPCPTETQDAFLVPNPNLPESHHCRNLPVRDGEETRLLWKTKFKPSLLNQDPYNPKDNGKTQIHNNTNDTHKNKRNKSNNDEPYDNNDDDDDDDEPTDHDDQETSGSSTTVPTTNATHQERALVRFPPPTVIPQQSLSPIDSIKNSIDPSLWMQSLNEYANDLKWCDELAKEIYMRSCDLLVHRIHSYTTESSAEEMKRSLEQESLLGAFRARYFQQKATSSSSSSSSQQQEHEQKQQSNDPTNCDTTWQTIQTMPGSNGEEEPDSNGGGGGSGGLDCKMSELLHGCYHNGTTSSSSFKDESTTKNEEDGTNTNHDNSKKTYPPSYLPDAKTMYQTSVGFLHKALDKDQPFSCPNESCKATFSCPTGCKVGTDDDDDDDDDDDNNNDMTEHNNDTPDANILEDHLRHCFQNEMIETASKKTDRLIRLVGEELETSLKHFTKDPKEVDPHIATTKEKQTQQQPYEQDPSRTGSSSISSRSTMQDLKRDDDPIPYGERRDCTIRSPNPEKDMISDEDDDGDDADEGMIDRYACVMQSKDSVMTDEREGKEEGVKDRTGTSRNTRTTSIQGFNDNDYTPNMTKTDSKNQYDDAEQMVLIPPSYSSISGSGSDGIPGNPLLRNRNKTTTTTTTTTTKPTTPTTGNNSRKMKGWDDHFNISRLSSSFDEFWKAYSSGGNPNNFFDMVEKSLDLLSCEHPTIRFSTRATRSAATATGSSGKE